MWKIVKVSEVLVLYIYILLDIYRMQRFDSSFLNNNFIFKSYFNEWAIRKLG